MPPRAAPISSINNQVFAFENSLYEVTEMQTPPPSKSDLKLDMLGD